MGRKKAINSSRGSCCWIFAHNKTSYPPLRSNRAKDISTSTVVGILPYGCHGVVRREMPKPPPPHKKKWYIILYTNNICRIILLNIYISYLSVLNICIHIIYIHKNYISFMYSCWYSTVGNSTSQNNLRMSTNICVLLVLPNFYIEIEILHFTHDKLLGMKRVEVAAGCTESFWQNRLTLLCKFKISLIQGSVFRFC